MIQRVSERKGHPTIADCLREAFNRYAAEDR